MSKETKGPSFILILKPNGEEYASLADCLTTVCVDAEDVVNTIMKTAMDDRDDIVDGNLDWSEEAQRVAEYLRDLAVSVEEDPEDNTTTFDVGDNEGDMYPGYEVHVKQL